MRIREVLDKLAQSKICKLVYNGDVVGLRVRLYDVEKDEFRNFDFEKEYISEDKETMKLLKSVYSGLESIQLFQKGDLLVSDEELRDNYLIGEIDSVRVAVGITRKAITTYLYLKEGADV